MRRFEVEPGSSVRLREDDAADASAYRGSKAEAVEETERLIARLDQLQELLYAGHAHPVLVVLQALDTGGKDGTIRHIFRGVNPQGVRVAQFRVPTRVELDHDFLWRVHAQAPAKGEIAIFNRSHYEDVLAARVERLAPRKVWKERYRSINEFERSLTSEGTTVIKFFLHISRAEQKRRLTARLKDRTKHWKFSANDLPARQDWPEYIAAYEEMLARTSTRRAPWHVIPSDLHWLRNWAVSRILVDTLEGLEMRWPKLPKEFRRIAVS